MRKTFRAFLLALSLSLSCIILVRCSTLIYSILSKKKNNDNYYHTRNINNCEPTSTEKKENQEEQIPRRDETTIKLGEIDLEIPISHEKGRKESTSGRRLHHLSRPTFDPVPSKGRVPAPTTSTLDARRFRIVLIIVWRRPGGKRSGAASRGGCWLRWRPRP